MKDTIPNFEVMEKEIFIAKVLNSVDGIVKASPDDVVLLRIEQHIKQNTITPKMIWIAAASIALLISLNLLVLHKSSFLSDTSELQVLEQSISKSNQLYK